MSEIARSLGMNSSSVRWWVNQGLLIPHRRRGRSWLIRRSELERMRRDHPSLGHAHGARRSSAVFDDPTATASPLQERHQNAVDIVQKGLEL